MATTLTVRTKSGDEFSCPLQSEHGAKSKQDVCEEFYQGIQIHTLATLRLGNRIFFVREIESLRFD